MTSAASAGTGVLPTKRTTRSKKSNWGGARKGAGRKPKAPKTPPVAAQEPLQRIADALDKIVVMLSLDLRSRGISHCLDTIEGEGELLTDDTPERDLFERKLAAAESDRDAYLRDWEASLRLNDPFGISWTGPEGAEDAAQNP